MVVTGEPGNDTEKDTTFTGPEVSIVFFALCQRRYSCTFCVRN